MRETGGWKKSGIMVHELHPLLHPLLPLPSPHDHPHGLSEGMLITDTHTQHLCHIAASPHHHIVNLDCQVTDKEDEGVHGGTNKEIHVRIPRLIVNTA